MSAHITFIALLLMLIPASACARDGRANATATTAASTATAGGASLEDRYSTALKQSAAATDDSHFWTVYSFDVRDGVGLDEPLPAGLDNQITLRGLRVSLRPETASRNVGIFILHRGGDDIERVEVHDLDRYQQDKQYPSKSLGRASAAESLQLLRRLYAKHSGTHSGERLVLAMALHNDPQVEGILKNIVAEAKNDKERGTAAMWLGQIPDQKDFLVNLANDAQTPVEVRKQAVVGLGFSKYPGVLAVLRNLYESSSSQEIKEQAIFAASNVENQAEATAFLNKVKDSDPNPDLRRQAKVWIERMSGAPKS